jgi:glycosyltransferase involved in cell wall biosynthesis
MRILLFLLPYSAFALHINLIGYSNGVGIDQDIAILGEELTNLGHRVEFVHILDFEPRQKADINLFIERVNPLFFPFAEKNYLIPNPEWYNKRDLIAKFDLILCKTKEAQAIFEQYSPRTLFLGFTSKDCYREEVQKELRLPIHLAGKSIQKGTDSLYDLWQREKLPPLRLLHHMEEEYPEVPNISQITDYLPQPELREWQNRYGLHLCLSETEGFGHYLNEALSTEAIVVTTDAPPMNEFVTDKRCLVKHRRTQKQDLAINYYFDQADFLQVFTRLLKLSDEELKEIGRQNRQNYLKNDQLFKQRLAEIFGEIK